MKNKYFSFVALAAAALATSCASDDLAEQKQEQNQNNAQTVTLTASVNDVQTRVGMTKNTNATAASFYWHKKDAISVLATSGSTYNNEKFTTEVEDGKTSATFTGTVTGTVGDYAVYPYNESHKFTSATALTYNLPATYTYDKVETNIFSKATDGTTSYPSNSTNMPMLGTISTSGDSKSISFKCLGGLAVIRINKMPAASGTLTVTADQQLSGNFTVDNLAATDAQITMATTDTEADKTVTFTYSNATQNGLGIFYLPLAVGTYTNVKVKIGENTADCGSVTVDRAGMTAVYIIKNNSETIHSDIKLWRRYGKTNRYYLGDNLYYIGGHDFIDLGLSSGLLWATMNFGAASETTAGGYYRWGETSTLTGSTYSITNSNYESAFKDVVNYTGGWGSYTRMPTKEELDELLTGCDWTWNSTDKGYTATSKTNEKSIFFYAGGYTMNGGTLTNTDTGEGYYWTSTYASSANSNVNAYRLYFKYNSVAPESGTSNGQDGFNIRPVAAKP